MKTTAAKSAKSARLKSLAEMSEITGIGRETLRVWHRDRPQLWAVIIAGCQAIKRENENGA